jgi:hypothetical protein
LPLLGVVIGRFLAGWHGRSGNGKGAKKRLNLLFNRGNQLEAEVGIEPASTALQCILPIIDLIVKTIATHNDALMDHFLFGRSPLSGKCGKAECT